LDGVPAWGLRGLPIPCIIVGAWPTGACPTRSRCEAARAYGDTTFFFAHLFFADASGALTAGFVAADGFGASAHADTLKNVAATNAALAPQARMI
jgi:hypothetical protein